MTAKKFITKLIFFKKNKFCKKTTNITAVFMNTCHIWNTLSSI